MRTKMLTMVAVVMTMVAAAWAGDIDTSALHPPPGSRIALVVFEDLQCPSCAATEPYLEQAVRDYREYHLTLVRHDFIIPIHNWSKEAHIMARYFDTQSPQLGEEFRQYIFANQSAIYNQTVLRGMADRFADQHHVALPAFYDPSGTLRAKVEADIQLGKATGVSQTPTIFVVSNSKQLPYVEVKDKGKLFETIDQVKAAVDKEPKPAKKTAAHGKQQKKNAVSAASKPDGKQKKKNAVSAASKPKPAQEKQTL
jgi:protein-disulfide isomerase